MSTRRAARSTAPTSLRRTDRARAPASSASERFRWADRYRVDREWARYEGTAQRRLWREIRERFLDRWAGRALRGLDLGAGPGRFTPWAAGRPGTAVALDLSMEMLRAIPEHWASRAVPRALPVRVRGDAAQPPFRPHVFDSVLALGNSIGFAEASSDQLMREAMRLVAPGGRFLFEIAPGPGEHARYLARLPASSVSRLLRAPPRGVLARIDREGFEAEPARRASEGRFRRLSVEEAARRLELEGWQVDEALAVAPVLGSRPDPIEAAGHDLKAWSHLIELEEVVGRRPERWPQAASVLVAARRVHRSIDLSSPRPPD